MRARLMSCIAGAACSLAGVVAANAHHALSAEYDNTRPIRL